LSYTQRLEQKVAQLEAALSAAKGGVSDSPINSASNTQSPVADQQPPPGSSRAVEALRVEDDGRVSFHGSTSLFQLPGSMWTHVLANSQADDEVAAKKESLANSAWRERAYEKLADIPVRDAHSSVY